MARRRTVGYIENEWVCPNCQTRNKGSVKTCVNCGAPQPENVQFELPAEQKLVTDKDSINAAGAGADIHCPFCGTRNPATAKTCSQCGGDLTEGKAREAGRVMQAPPSPQPKIIKCDNCGVENPASAHGVIVMQVQKGTPAGRKEIKPGDIITAVDHRSVSDPKEFRDALKKADLKKGILLDVLSGKTARFEILKSE